MTLLSDANAIINAAIASALPDAAVKRALKDAVLPEKVRLVSIGKAGYRMAEAAYEVLGSRIEAGIVITKYRHAEGDLGPISVYEAGHPVPDQNGIDATARALELVKELTEKDTVILLISGGGSTLFEKPLVPLDELQDITNQLLASGADIVEINTIRKRLSAVKGGRFALECAPAKVFCIVLSDIIGDPLDMIASGPAYPDSSTCFDALKIAEKHKLRLSDAALKLLSIETPKELHNVTTLVTGSVTQLCTSAAATAKELGYKPTILTASLNCTARDAGSFLASIAQYHSNAAESLAFIAGGETVVRLTGKGLGGRNQELALSAAESIAGLKNTAIFSVGSDGTDGPTDAAGGYADGSTKKALAVQGISIPTILDDNDSYHALEKCGGLIFTGATGTNVNDLSVLLIKR